MTEEKAWRLIAEEFSGRKNQYTNIGLCNAICLMFTYSLYPNGRHTFKMKERIRFHLVYNMYVYPAKSKYRMARSLAALWLALESKEENIRNKKEG